MGYAEYRDQKLAMKNRGVVALVSFFFPPAGYFLVGRTGWAVLCFLTAGFLLTGFIIVPIHTWIIVKRARQCDQM